MQNFGNEPHNIEAISKILIMCQLVDDFSIFRQIVSDQPLDLFTNKISWENLKPYEARRNLEIYLRVAQTKTAKNLNSPNAKGWLDIFSKQKQITNISETQKLLGTYKGIFKIDKFQYTIVILKLLLLQKQTILDESSENKIKSNFNTEYQVSFIKSTT